MIDIAKMKPIVFEQRFDKQTVLVGGAIAIGMKPPRADDGVLMIRIDSEDDIGVSDIECKQHSGYCPGGVSAIVRPRLACRSKSTSTGVCFCLPRTASRCPSGEKEGGVVGGEVSVVTF